MRGRLLRLKMKYMEAPKETAKVTPKNAQTENSATFFARAKYMLVTSVGKLPTALVVIMLIALAMAAVTGLTLQLNKSAARSTEFMPQRLSPSDGAVELEARQLKGSWIYQTADYAMAVTFIDDRFEWMILFKDIPEAQFFARGNYRIVGDVMILGVRPDLGSPYDSARTWMKYMPIAMKDLNTKISIQNKKLIWDVPSSEQRKMLSQSSRIFVGHTDGHIEWTKQ